jgi:membrane protein implicated in regulation of membrane protease activity
MNRTCCNTKHRKRTFAGWVLPGVVLALVPKCPMCVAAYIAIATGLSISVAIATYLRLGLITVCAASLVFFTTRFVKRVVASQQKHHTPT